MIQEQVKVCILSTTENVEAVRKTAKSISIFKSTQLENILRIPLSADGKKPITHWFCMITVLPDIANKLKSLQELSIMEFGVNSRAFLSSHGLRVVRESKDD